MKNINDPANQNATNPINSKWPDYLIQWRTSLWVSLREKESNVWKFVTFYAASISLIIGLGQKLATTLDVTIDIAVAAAIVGLLTFWGLAIVIDSNSWMARNLKLIGNIERIFIKADQYDKLIPGDYSSPIFRYQRPYTVDFFFLVVLGIIAYLNFIIHFPLADPSWRQYLPPSLTILYVFGFERIQSLDSSTRDAYFWFFKNAKGEPLKNEAGNTIVIGADKMPPEYWEFERATTASFHHWASLAATLIIIVYGVRAQLIAPNFWIKLITILVAILEVVYLIVSRLLSSRLQAKGKREKPVDWATLSGEPLIWGQKVEPVKKFYLRFVSICRVFILISIFVLVGLSYSQQLRAVLHL